MECGVAILFHFCYLLISLITLHGLPTAPNISPSIFLKGQPEDESDDHINAHDDCQQRHIDVATENLSQHHHGGTKTHPWPDVEEIAVVS